jgi:hypothetical protein
VARRDADRRILQPALLEGRGRIRERPIPKARTCAAHMRRHANFEALSGVSHIESRTPYRYIGGYLENEHPVVR